MVVTPWGQSDSLRDRMLRPGPGTPREEVVRNQRERLFAAMVASVAERGYEATRVDDLVELSGVSSRSFYDLFADKRSCFQAAVEAMIEGAAAFALRGANDGGTWEERAQRGFENFATMIVAQPAAARLLLVDAFAAGSEVMAILERAVEGFEQMTAAMLAQSPERAAMPAEMIQAHVGAQAEIARTRLRRGREGELPTLMKELWGMVLAYRPPPYRCARWRGEQNRDRSCSMSTTTPSELCVALPRWSQNGGTRRPRWGRLRSARRCRPRLFTRISKARRTC